MLVMKFSGSTLESRSGVARCADIIRSYADQNPLVVVSAMGKTTNRLFDIARIAARGERAQAEQALRELRIYTLREGGSVGGAVEERFEELFEIVNGLAALAELTPRALDLVASFGERISSLIVADAVRNLGVRAMQYEARSLLVTDDRHLQATPMIEETRRRAEEQLLPLLKDNVVVLGGFIGATREGVTTTLGRGGSDYTAAVFGVVCGASEIQIWTDVDGMLTCDPRLVPESHRIKRLSFAEASELAYFGAKVLHPATIVPAREANIPVRIMFTHSPKAEGTRLTVDPISSPNLFKSIAIKRGVAIVHVHSTQMMMSHGFLKKIFDVFDRYETSIDVVATSEVSISLTVDAPQRLPALVAHLSPFSDVKVEERESIISLVGEGLNHRCGVLRRVFDALGDINVRMVSQGASNVNLSIVVSDADVQSAAQRLHKEFFSDPDPQIFETH